MKTHRNIIAAFQFLTSIPLPIKTGNDHLERSIVWFPLVGAVIGMVVGFSFQFCRLTFNENISAVITIFVYIILTRGLHLDGFMDTIDGFSSRKDRPSILKIMKEPTVGSFAVLGAGTWFLLVFSTLPLIKPADYIIIHALSRTGILFAAPMFSYPRESGTGKFFVENVKFGTLLGAVVINAIIMAVLCFPDIPGSRQPAAWSLYIPVYAGFFLVTLFISMGIGYWSKKKINGITGDILGFIIETTHLVLILLIISAFTYI